MLRFEDEFGEENLGFAFVDLMASVSHALSFIEAGRMAHQKAAHFIYGAAKDTNYDSSFLDGTRGNSRTGLWLHSCSITAGL